MPHRNNKEITARIIREGLFSSQAENGLLTDNWRLVQDSQGNNALLYVVIFHSTSASGEPRRIPNRPTTVTDLFTIHAQVPSPKIGPFIALAELSGDDLVNCRVWNITAWASTQNSRIQIKELGKPYWQYP